MYKERMNLLHKNIASIVKVIHCNNVIVCIQKVSSVSDKMNERLSFL